MSCVVNGMEQRDDMAPSIFKCPAVCVDSLVCNAVQRHLGVIYLAECFNKMSLDINKGNFFTF